MKFLDKISKRFTENAAPVLKKEVKKTAIDLLPGAFALLASILGAVLFKEKVTDTRPTLTSTHTITNNYFLGDTSKYEKDIIQKIIKED